MVTKTLRISFIRVGPAARVLGISPGSVRALGLRGELPFIVVKGHRLYRLDAVLERARCRQPRRGRRPTAQSRTVKFLEWFVASGRPWKDLDQVLEQELESRGATA